MASSGEKDGEAKSPISRDPEHHQQECQSHSGGIYVNDAPVDLRYEFGGHEAGGIAEQVLWPAGFHGHDCNRNQGCKVSEFQGFEAKLILKP